MYGELKSSINVWYAKIKYLCLVPYEQIINQTAERRFQTKNCVSKGREGCLGTREPRISNSTCCWKKKGWAMLSPPNAISHLCTLIFCSGNFCFIPDSSRHTNPAQFGLDMLVPIMSCFFCRVQLGTGDIAPPGAITLTPEDKHRTRFMVNFP